MPRPERGYWAKLAARKKVTKAELPMARPGDEQTWVPDVPHCLPLWIVEHAVAATRAAADGAKADRLRYQRIAELFQRLAHVVGAQQT